MPTLFVVFLATAWLNELVLAVGLANRGETRRAAAALAVAVGVVLLMAALLAGPFADFLRAFAFSSLLMQLASARKQAARLPGAMQSLRLALPLLAGSVAVLASVAATMAAPARATIALCLGLPMALALLVPIAVAMLDRLQLSTTPALLRGAPIMMVSAALLALGLMGLAPVLPW